MPAPAHEASLPSACRSINSTFSPASAPASETSPAKSMPTTSGPEAEKAKHEYLQAAFADGILSASEERLLLHICSKLRVSRFDYEHLKIQLLAKIRFQGRSSYTRNTPQKTSLQDAYGVLGLTPSASKAEVKKAYRRLMSQNHPDKLVAKGLPEEMMRLAKEKTQKISKAYETIQKAG